MNGTELKGKGILKVVGILYIVFAALSILVGLLGLLGGGLLAVGGLGAEAYIGAGLGFAVMQSFMDKVRVTSAPGKGTRVVMSKRLASRG